VADNILNARIKLKYDSLTNWNSSSFIPLVGEVCIAYIPNTDNTKAPTICMKVGDGIHTFA